MNEPERVLKERAEARNGIYDWFRADYIFVRITSDDYMSLKKDRDILGLGQVLESRIMRIQHTFRGDWDWVMMDEEAYEFCKAIRKYLLKYDTKRYHWCQNCIKVHEARKHWQDAHADPA